MVSPSDVLSLRDTRKNVKVKRSIKFEYTKAKEDDLSGHIVEAAPVVEKIYISQDSYSVQRLESEEVGKFYLCKICGNFSSKD